MTFSRQPTIGSGLKITYKQDHLFFIMQEEIAIASDHAGFVMKETLKQTLAELGYTARDFGTDSAAHSVDYPDYATKVCEWVSAGQGRRAVLVCGSGVGMSIAANRHRSIRAVLAGNGLTARLARMHNNANVLCLGARLTGTEHAIDALREFLRTAFEGGRHETRVNKLQSC